MVIALKEKRKTQTRRVIKDEAEYACLTGDCDHSTQDLCDRALAECGGYGVPGDFIYCKESVIPAGRARAGVTMYGADFTPANVEEHSKALGGWKPSILMREDEARFWYRLRAVRVQRLQEITEADAEAEGIFPAQRDGSYVTAYADLWNEINDHFAPVRRKEGKTWSVHHYLRFPWDGVAGETTHKGKPAFIVPNPHVFALTFEPVSQSPTR
jgi:hypothetical protein